MIIIFFKYWFIYTLTHTHIYIYIYIFQKCPFILVIGPILCQNLLEKMIHHMSAMWGFQPYLFILILRLIIVF